MNVWSTNVQLFYQSAGFFWGEKNWVLNSVSLEKNRIFCLLFLWSTPIVNLPTQHSFLVSEGWGDKVPAVWGAEGAPTSRKGGWDAHTVEARLTPDGGSFYISKHRLQIRTSKVFDGSWRNGLSVGTQEDYQKSWGESQVLALHYHASSVTTCDSPPHSVDR